MLSVITSYQFVVVEVATNWQPVSQLPGINATLRNTVTVWPTGNAVSLTMTASLLAAANASMPGDAVVLVVLVVVDSVVVLLLVDVVLESVVVELEVVVVSGGISRPAGKTIRKPKKLPRAMSGWPEMRLASRQSAAL